MIDDDLNLSDVPRASEMAVVAENTTVEIFKKVARSIKPPICMYILCIPICKI